MKNYLTITLAAISLVSFPGRSHAENQDSNDLPVVGGSTVSKSSTVGGKIEIPLTTFSRLLNQSESKTFRKTTGIERYNVRLQKFSVSSTGKGLVLKTPISGNGTIYKEKRKGMKAHVNFDIKYGSVTVHAVPEITSDFQIKTNITSIKMDAQITWRTKLFKGNRGIQQNFARSEVTKMARDLDQQLSAKLNLRGEVARIWEQTHGVLPIPGNPSTFLVTQPVSVRCGKPDFRDRSKIQFAISLECNSAIHMEQPEAPDTKAMPRLEIRKGQSTATAFRTPLTLPLANLESMMKGEVVEIPLRDEKILTLSNLRLRAESHNRLVVDGDFAMPGDSSSSERGTLSMSAAPRFSSSNQQLRFADLKFAESTRSQLLDRGLESIVNPEVEQSIANEVVIDLSSQMKAVMEQAGQLPYLNSEIDLQKVQVDGVKLARMTDGEAAVIDLVLNQPGGATLKF